MKRLHLVLLGVVCVLSLAVAVHLSVSPCVDLPTGRARGSTLADEGGSLVLSGTGAHCDPSSTGQPSEPRPDAVGVTSAAGAGQGDAAIRGRVTSASSGSGLQARVRIQRSRDPSREVVGEVATSDSGAFAFHVEPQALYDVTVWRVDGGDWSLLRGLQNIRAPADLHLAIESRGGRLDVTPMPALEGVGCRLVVDVMTGAWERKVSVASRVVDGATVLPVSFPDLVAGKYTVVARGNFAGRADAFVVTGEVAQVCLPVEPAQVCIVQVTDLLERPLGNCIVRFTNETLGATKTDGQGIFSVPYSGGSRFCAVVSCRGYEATAAWIEDLVKEPRLRLRAARSAVVRMSADPGSIPWRSPAVVELTARTPLFPGGPAEAQHVAVVEPGQHAEVVFEGLRHGVEYSITATCEPCALWGTGLLHGDDAAVEILLGPGWRVTGIVVDSEGTPICGASVQATVIPADSVRVPKVPECVERTVPAPPSGPPSRRESATTGSGGEFSLVLPRGVHAEVWASDWLPRTSATVFLSEDSSHAVMRLRETRAIRGRVTLVDGKPVQDALVVGRYGERHWEQSFARTDPLGEFTLGDTPGDCRVIVFALHESLRSSCVSIAPGETGADAALLLEATGTEGPVDVDVPLVRLGAPP